MNGKVVVYLAGLTGFIAITGACQNAAPANTANVNQVNINQVTAKSSPAANLQGNSTSQTIETNEPNNYSASLELSAETTEGERNAGIPALTAKVARDEEKRRVAFNLPNGDQVIYLNLGATRYLIMPNRRQYAELSPNAVGFELPRLMMPDQIVENLKSRTGFQQLGEEDFKGRRVVKYRSAGTTQTGTQAGQINAESFTYVDKETGLPLRVEFASQATGNVQGVGGLNAVIEMRDVKTEIEPSLFEVPQGYAKVSQEEVRNQVNTVIQAATAIAGAFLNNMNAPTPAVSPTVNAQPNTR